MRHILETDQEISILIRYLLKSDMWPNFITMKRVINIASQMCLSFGSKWLFSYRQQSDHKLKA